MIPSMGNRKESEDDSQGCHKDCEQGHKDCDSQRNADRCCKEGQQGDMQNLSVIFLSGCFIDFFIEKIGENFVGRFFGSFLN